MGGGGKGEGKMEGRRPNSSMEVVKAIKSEKGISIEGAMEGEK